MGINSKQKIGAVITAAGNSQRMNGIDKIFTPLAGKPVLFRVIDTFQRCNDINQIVVVISEQNLVRGQYLIAQQGWSKVTDVCAGGSQRQDSVLAGLKLLKECDWVVIHDGARPLVTVDLIKHGIEAVRETGAAAAAIPVTDTIKLVGNDKIVYQTPLRQNLWAVQTPQVFDIQLITEAYSQVKSKVTDDASLVEQLGHKVKLYMGSQNNIKITNPDDLILAELLWNKYGK
ncbi:MAG: 2-C-methyl-D-erythritol 4-phosphate cytidylyltransferase [Dehalococcoidales bacterium]|nr:2-C-methyl-D-erythritol 4-phosphate cytidylyltransferase [Dehalococcoidales bacterium]